MYAIFTQKTKKSNLQFYCLFESEVLTKEFTVLNKNNFYQIKSKRIGRVEVDNFSPRLDPVFLGKTILNNLKAG